MITYPISQTNLLKMNLSPYSTDTACQCTNGSSTEMIQNHLVDDNPHKSKTSQKADIRELVYYVYIHIRV